MLKINFKKFFLYSGIVIFVFILDRISKIYILNLVEINNEVDIYVFSFLMLYLIWNKGIAFGLLSFEQNFVYNFITIFPNLSIVNYYKNLFNERNQFFNSYNLCRQYLYWRYR